MSGDVLGATKILHSSQRVHLTSMKERMTCGVLSLGEEATNVRIVLIYRGHLFNWKIFSDAVRVPLFFLRNQK